MKDLQIYDWGIKEVISSKVDIAEDQSKYAKKMVEIWQEGTTAYLNLKLRNENAAENAVKILENAQSYELTPVVVFLAEELMKYYPYRGDKEKTTFYQNILKKYQDIHQAETQAEYYLCEVDKKIVQKISNDEVIAELEKYVLSIEKILYKFNSINFLINAYKLKLRLCQIKNDTPKIISLSREAMTRISSKEFELPYVIDVLFMHPLIPIHIEAQEFSKADFIVKALCSKIKKGTVNWFVAHSYDVLLNFQKQDFEKVGKLVDQFKRYNNPVHKHRYQIYEAYLSLFTKRKFKLGKFTNEVFELSKDRSGYRLNIIIIKLLHLLKYKKYGEYIDRVEAIERYMYRYLNSSKRKDIRNRSFLKILLSIPKANFNSIAFERKTAALFQRLKDTPINSTTQLLEQEPIHYEYLYSFVKGLLK